MCQGPGYHRHCLTVHLHAATLVPQVQAVLDIRALGETPVLLRDFNISLQAYDELLYLLFQYMSLNL